ncbi:EpsG family protein [Clostridioides difficile]
MTVFYLTLLSVYIFSFLARVIREKHKGIAWVFVIIVILIVTLVSGLRSGIGDTYMYKHLYELIGPDFNSDGYEVGFIFFLQVLKYISDNPQFMIIITSIIINVLNIISMYIFTKDGYFEIATFLYIASGYYTVTMNGIRQSLAGSILFIATVFIIKKKLIYYLIFCIVAISIHNSAFVMIPMYFIVREKAWHKKTNILYALMLIGLFFYDPIMNMLQGTRYGGYSDFDEGGANIIRITVFLVPIFIAYLKRKSIRLKWKNGDIFVNMTIVCGIIMLFSAFNWIFARFTIYFQPYSFIVFAFLLKNCFEKKEKRLIYFGLIVCYFMFFYYEQAISLGMKYPTDFNLNKFLYY